MNIVGLGSPISITITAVTGKIRVENAIIFLSKYISSGDIYMTLSPDVGNNSCKPHIQINQTVDVQKLSYV